MPSTPEMYLSDVSRSSVRERGITMVELVITMAVMAVIMAAVTPLFTLLSRSFTNLEAGSVLPAGTQKALNRIQNRLGESRRLFENTTIGAAYLAKLPALPRTPVGWGQLPTINPGMALSTHSAVFVSSAVGNSLCFASTYAPNLLTNVGTVGTTVRVDSFMFNYYFISENTSVVVNGKPSLELWEWHSIPYADYQQLSLMTPARSSSTALALRNQYGVTFAWDSSADVPASAFYVLSTTGGVVAAPTHVIQTATDPKLRSANMIQVISGAASGGFKFGVSRNGFPQSHQVPIYGYNSSASDFPGGLEIMIVGPSSSRQVFVRLVVTAQGNFKGLLSYENVVLLSARDLY